MNDFLNSHALQEYVVSLRRELSDLQSENVTLSAQYEKVFDLATIQEAVGDTMIRPTNDQVVYIDLSEPDTVVVFETSGIEGGLRSLRQGLERVVDGIVEYFPLTGPYRCTEAPGLSTDAVRYKRETRGDGRFLSCSLRTVRESEGGLPSLFSQKSDPAWPAPESRREE